MKSIRVLVAALAMFLFSASAVSAQTAPLSGMCIALVHGILGFDDTTGLANGLVKYWGGLDGYLRSQGAKVTTPGSSAMNDLPTRAGQIKSAVSSWMTTNSCTKVHLIGHSQGGLVIRYMVNKLSFASKTASISTVDSLHKGAPMADIVLAIIPSWLQPFTNTCMGLLAKLVYRDGRPQDVIAMGKSLTVSYSGTINAMCPNLTGIKYRSYGNKMAWADPIQHPIMALTYPITWAGGLYYGMGSANDGVVPFSSQNLAGSTWYGAPSSKWYATGIDHLQATNFEWSGQYYFDVQGWYKTIALNVK